MNDMESTTVMTVREISEVLRLTESTVYKLLHEGKLPGRKVGGQWRVSRKAFEGWLEEREGKGDEKEVFPDDSALRKGEKRT